MPWWRKPFTLIFVPHDGSESHSISIRWVTIFIACVFGVSLLLSPFLAIIGGYRTSVMDLAFQTKSLDQKLEKLKTKQQKYKNIEATVKKLKGELKETRNRYTTILKLSGFQSLTNHSEAGEVLEKLAKTDNPKKLLKRTKKALKQKTTQNKKLAKVENFIKNRFKVLEHTPLLWPVEGWLSSPYGPRKNPMGGKGRSFHDGIDIAAWQGSVVRAPADGKIVFSGYKGGYGKMVKIRHKYGYSSLFGHLSKNIAGKGDAVKKGEAIGRVGSTGHSTGSHVHYEIRINGDSVNPWPYLVEHYQSFKSYSEQEAS